MLGGLGNRLLGRLHRRYRPRPRPLVVVLLKWIRGTGCLVGVLPTVVVVISVCLIWDSIPIGIEEEEDMLMLKEAENALLLAHMT